MSHGIYGALSGAIAQQRSLDVVANNVANASTAGYQADRVAFDEVIARAGDPPGSPPRGQPASLRYAVASRLRTDTSAGTMRATERPLDLALDGAGFFALQTPNGVRYTRAGAFVADASGLVQTPDGLPLIAEGDPRTARIVIPPGTRDITVGSDGNVSADGQSIGRIRITRFADPSALPKEGLTRFVAPPGTQPLSGEGTSIVQGALEASNVNAVSGVIELVNVTRSFETLQRVIQAFRDLDSRTAKELGART